MSSNKPNNGKYIGRALKKTKLINNFICIDEIVTKRPYIVTHTAIRRQVKACLEAKQHVRAAEDALSQNTYLLETINT